MQIPKIVVASALAGAVTVGAAACSDSKSSTDAGASASSAINQASAAVGSAVADGSSSISSSLDGVILGNDDAQIILRKIVDPATSASADAALVDSTDPSIGQQLNGFAVGASQGGYTPGVFTVTSVETTGPNNAVAAVSVKSPHAPAPVTVKYDYVRVDGNWKLSGTAAKQLLSMAGGPH